MSLYTAKLETRISGLKGKISETNIQLIKDFIRQCDIEGLTEFRKMKYVSTLKQIALMMNDKPLNEAVKTDIEDVLIAVRKKTESEETRHDYAVTLKKYYRWLNGGKESELTDFFQSTKKSKGRKLPEELLTEDEVNKMIEATRNTRDQALIAILWDSGCRIGEIGNLKIKHIMHSDEGMKIRVDGKTGHRTVMLFYSVRRLMAWLEQHPERDNPNAPLWWNFDTNKNNTAKMISYPAILKQLKKIAKKAGIKKRIHAHLFRHSRATYMANHLTEAQMNSYFGWVQGSDVPSIYVHLSGRDVDTAVLKANGVELEEEENKPKVHKCPRCKTLNTPNNMFCFKCGSVLTLEKALEIEEKSQPLEDSLSKLMESRLNELVEARVNEILQNIKI
ncbi:Site-specific recombinase XerD [Methanolobus vulcani]|uniref:Site-specific recombinase XerD n=1 Tax=Methanolobus vulcani TaxID=38026 RepID=A0A7Z7AWL8_9EURY|nr:tyrosine-type recombinase/integrase [Methanolobus vulcani]SDF85298.1 Site-specific recombinase XerD [Methanolobus vulcani]